MKRAIAIVCICVSSFCLFANQSVKTLPENQVVNTVKPDALEYLLTIAQYDKTITDRKAPWETDEEFRERIHKDREVIQLISQMEDYKKDFSREEYLIGFETNVVKVFSFDTENKQFPIEIYSNDSLFPFWASLYYKITATDWDAISKDYSRIEDAYAAGALVASIRYTVIEKYPQIWEIAFTSVSLYNQLESENKTKGLIKEYYSNEIKRIDADQVCKIQNGKFVPLYAVVPIVAIDSQEASIIVEDRAIGAGSAVCEIKNYRTKNISVKVQLEARATENISITVEKGINPPVEIGFSKVGELGQAGGYIFYDKCYYSDGWRFLEAAPSGWSGAQEDPKYFFGYYRPSDRNLEVGTSTDVGSGSANTVALVRAMKKNQVYTELSGSSKKVNYAARVAYDYKVKVGGVTYYDWFLPSKDELNLMCTNLHNKRLGGFSVDSYWSSSEYDASEVWLQSFRYGYGWSPYYNFRDNAARVRPVRRF